VADLDLGDRLPVHGRQGTAAAERARGVTAPRLDEAPAGDSRAWRAALLVVAAGTLVRIVFAAILPVFPDEAYYWTWSRHLAAGYFDHPPMIALLIGLGGLLAPAGRGATGLCVRLGPVLAGGIACLAAIATARRLAGNRAALWAALAITCMPLAAAGLVLATPDAPLLATTALTLYAVVRALELDESEARARLAWWAAAGVALGLAFSSKYTSILIPLGVVGATIVHPRLRWELRTPGPWVACVLATLVFMPVLVWNAGHGWISFTFQVHHGLAAPQSHAVRKALQREGDFLGGQAGLASPILFVLMVVAVGRALRIRRDASLRERARFALAAVGLLSCGLFVYSALRQRVEPNWPSAAYIPAIVLLATASWGRRGSGWLRAGVGLAALLSVLVYVQAIVPVLPLAPRRDPVARAFGWETLARAADSTAHAVTAATRHRTWLGADRYQEASELAFHSSDTSASFAVNLASRPNQYDLWPGFAASAAIGDNLVLALDDHPGGEDPVIAKLAQDFAVAEPGALVSLRRGAGVVGTRRLWTLRGWTGRWPR
jgi:4-amino-4-deoxy-L-arabinose transferase-like glycosyltransferase